MRSPIPTHASLAVARPPSRSMPVVRRILAYCTGGGLDAMKGQMLLPPVRLISARRFYGTPKPTGAPKPWPLGVRRWLTLPLEAQATMPVLLPLLQGKYEHEAVRRRGLRCHRAAGLRLVDRRLGRGGGGRLLSQLQEAAGAGAVHCRASRRAQLRRQVRRPPQRSPARHIRDARGALGRSSDTCRFSCRGASHRGDGKW